MQVMNKVNEVLSSLEQFKQEKKDSRSRYLQEIIKMNKRLALGPVVKAPPPAAAPKVVEEEMTETKGYASMFKKVMPKIAVAAPVIPKETPKDAYAMAFKALNLGTQAELDLSANEVLNAF